MLVRVLAGVSLLVFSVAAHAGGVSGDAIAGQEKSKPCAACHGPTGNESITDNYPKLAGQHPEYLVKVLHDYKTGKRNNLIMAGMVAGLSDHDINDLAVFFSKQNGELRDLSDISAR